MSDKLNKFFATSENEDFAFLNHNETDYSSFKEFQSSIDKKFAKVEIAKSKKDRIANLQKWDDNLSQRWSGASLKKIKTTASEKVLDIISKDGFGSFFINGAPGSGKTYLAYAILRRYVGAGWVSPSQVKIISEETILGYARNGFEGSGKFEEIFKNKYKVFLLDNVGVKKEYYEKEGLFLEKIIDHIYSNSLVVIFTGTIKPSRWAGALGSSESKFSNIISGRVVVAEGSYKHDLEVDGLYDGDSENKEEFSEQFK